MASSGQKFSSYSTEFKEEVLETYKLGKYGGRNQVAKHYNISSGTICTWIRKYRRQGSLDNDIFHKRGRQKEKDLTKEDYKERYEILKKYQAFLKAQREKK